MRVLVLSNIEWSDSNAFGNTMTNLFSGISDIELASLYRRSSLPANNVCKKYYKISVSSVLKKFFSPEKIGAYFEADGNESVNVNITKNVDSEKKAISFIHKFKLNNILYFAEDLLFATKRWENERFKSFINDFKPDIVFSFAKASKTHLLFINTVKKYIPDCKCVSFIVDDICSAFKSKTHKKIIAEQLQKAARVYAITPSLKRKYEELFGIEIDILTKGCDFTLPVKEKNSLVKTMVYAGNLLYGRDKTLIELGRAIKAHNDNSEHNLLLKIYSPTIVDESVKNAMNVSGASEYMGAKPYNEIVEILNEADIALHVESFDEQQQEIVKHSFSTKITDCMQSGSVLFSIGPDGLASIEAAKNIDGAFCATNSEEIVSAIEKIAVCDLYDNAKRIRAYALEHFAVDRIQEKIVNDFKMIV